MANLEKKFDKSEVRFDKIDADMTDLEKRFDKSEAKVEARFDKFDARLDRLEASIAKVLEQTKPAPPQAAAEN